MARYTFEFLRFVLRRRAPGTTVTADEHALLRRLARGASSVVEVGVHEGASSLELCKAMPPAGTLYLVDPYLPGVRLEKLLGVSFAAHVARSVLRPWRDRVRFVRKPSVDAARALADLRADLVFIDAVHSYAAVREDFLAWRSRLAVDGVIAFHDSRVCPERPDLRAETGPVRLVREIRAGAFGPWACVGEAGSVSAFASGEATTAGAGAT
jgi:predicted O-methyltransferase YrrM